MVEAPKDRALRREEKATIEPMCFQHALNPFMLGEDGWVVTFPWWVVLG